jgi:hypothetical protein
MSEKKPPKKFLSNFVGFKLPAANRYEILFFNKDEFNNIMNSKSKEINMPSIKLNNGKINTNILSTNLENDNIIKELDKELDKENNNTLNPPSINNKEIKNKYELLRKVSYFGMYFNYTDEETLKKRFNRNQLFNYKFYNNSNPLYNLIKNAGKKFKSFIIERVYNSCIKNEGKIIQGINDILKTQNINKSYEEIEDIVNKKIITKNFVSKCIENIPKKIILDNNDIQVIKNITNNPNDIQVIKNIKNNNTKIKAIKEINIKNIQEILNLLSNKTGGSINHYIILDIKKDSRIGSIKEIKKQTGGDILGNIFTFILYIIRVFVGIVIGAGICIGATALSAGFLSIPGCYFGSMIALLIVAGRSSNGKTALNNPLLLT